MSPVKPTTNVPQTANKKGPFTEAVAPSNPSTGIVTQPTFEQIQMRAYHLWLQRGQVEGSEAQNWLDAEQELIRELNSSMKPGKTS